ncbi:lysis system i-spanin subunit Rz [Pseudomonas lurida]|uniref:lysis system i-spanin subunit Rz n=1 Tax=Pseudomonas lurida TaxID=244566 RepID=UPI0027367624|nr:lysis system i-spanin subunit Rz [Pseudomonas lurida]WLG26001.1 lysis system i-spanin subunit Rz [Pseudomonas lurida]
MTPGQILGAILLAMVVSAAGTWQVQDWRYDGRLADQADQFQTDLGLVSAAAAKQARDETDKRLALEQQLAGQDQQHTRELSDAQRNQAVLRDRLATSDVRLSVLLDAADSASGCNVPAAPCAVGVVHGAARAQLDPAHAQRIIAITDDGDNAVIALRACQGYARAVSKEEK